MMVEKEGCAGGAVKTAHLAKLSYLAKSLAERVNPGRGSCARKTLPETQSGLPNGGDSGAKRKRYNLDILDF